MHVIYSSYYILTTAPLLGCLIPFFVYAKQQRQKLFRPTHKQLDRLGRAAGEPVGKVRKANFNGVQVIRAFGKEDDCVAEYNTE